jgi:hypothetical protein
MNFEFSDTQHAVQETVRKLVALSSGVMPALSTSPRFDWPITITALMRRRYEMEGFYQVST